MEQSPEAHTPSGVRHTYILDRLGKPFKVYYAAVNGLAIYQGDIVLGTVEQMEAIRTIVEERKGSCPRG